MIRLAGWALALLVVIGFILLRVRWRWPSPASPHARPNAKPTPRPLIPRGPDDCPACRAAQPGLPPPASTPLKPYPQVKSSRGRKKRIMTAGYACPNPDCLYYGVTDDQVHALVGYGGHGRQEYIRDLKCQACQTKFSVRYGTVLYRLKTCAGYTFHPGEFQVHFDHDALLGRPIVLSWLLRSSAGASVRWLDIMLRSGSATQLTVAEICTDVQCSQHRTVKSHINHILGKLGSRNRTEAVARARGLGLLEI